MNAVWHSPYGIHRLLQVLLKCKYIFIIHHKQTGALRKRAYHVGGCPYNIEDASTMLGMPYINENASTLFAR